MNIIAKIYDNTKDGVPNYSFDMEDGRRLYYSGVQMNPMPVTGDAINFTIIATKTSANGNQYTTIKDVEVIKNPDGHNDAPQPIGNVMEKLSSPQPINGGNPLSKSDTQRLDIFVTGVVGRSMGSGHFSVHDIEELTKNAVRAFNENLKKL
jgi:hypothetical protein|tara:strand:- start:9 stop:461 length:453 start_codon:yes stop_codon:yes gene_type:complete